MSEAADKIAGRDPPQQTPDRQPGLEESLRMVLAKLEQSMTAPSIVINNNQNGLPVKPSQANQYSQTDAIMKCDNCSSEQQLQNNLELHEPPEHTEVSDSCAAFHPCKVCEQLFESVTALESHMANHSSTHGSLLSQTCTECGRKFWSVEHLLEHTESEHAAQFLSCSHCNYKCSSNTHLKDHLETCHVEGGRTAAHSRNL